MKQDHTALRFGLLRAMPTSAPRFPPGPADHSLFDVWGESTPRYKVAVEVEGKIIEGYLSASEIDGLDEFDRIRRDATWVDTTQFSGAQIRLIRRGPAIALPRESRNRPRNSSKPGSPAKALEMLSARAGQEERSYVAGAWPASRLGVTTIAAALSNTGAARSTLQPESGSLESLLRRVERETQSDQSTDKLSACA